MGSIDPKKQKNPLPSHAVAPTEGNVTREELTRPEQKQPISFINLDTIMREVASSHFLDNASGQKSWQMLSTSARDGIF